MFRALSIHERAHLNEVTARLAKKLRQIWAIAQRAPVDDTSQGLCFPDVLPGVYDFSTGVSCSALNPGTAVDPKGLPVSIGVVDAMSRAWQQVPRTRPSGFPFSRKSGVTLAELINEPADPATDLPAVPAATIELPVIWSFGTVLEVARRELGLPVNPEIVLRLLSPSVYRQFSDTLPDVSDTPGDGEVTGMPYSDAVGQSGLWLLTEVGRAACIRGGTRIHFGWDPGWLGKFEDSYEKPAAESFDNPRAMPATMLIPEYRMLGTVRAAVDKGLCRGAFRAMEKHYFGAIATEEVLNRESDDFHKRSVDSLVAVMVLCEARDGPFILKTHDHVVSDRILEAAALRILRTENMIGFTDSMRTMHAEAVRQLRIQQLHEAVTGAVPVAMSPSPGNGSGAGVRRRVF